MANLVFLPIISVFNAAASTAQATIGADYEVVKNRCFYVDLSANEKVKRS